MRDELLNELRDSLKALAYEAAKSRHFACVKAEGMELCLNARAWKNRLDDMYLEDMEEHDLQCAVE